MLRTITIGSCVFIQGLLIGEVSDGMIKIKVDDKIYVGRAVESKRSN